MKSQTKIAELKTGSNLNTVDPDGRVFANPNRTPESDERLRIIDDFIAEAQHENPYIVAATVFGSTVHGGANAESDIDAFVFVDPADLPEEFSSEADGERVLTEKDARDMGRAIQVDLMGELGESITRGGKHEKNDVKVFAVNEEILQERINERVKQIEASEHYSTERDRLMDEYFAQDNRTDEPLEEFLRRQIGERPSHVVLDRSISALFHPGVGGTERLVELRQATLNILAGSPRGREIWQNIVDTVQTFEGDLHLDRQNALLPGTIDEARVAWAA